MFPGKPRYNNRQDHRIVKKKLEQLMNIFFQRINDLRKLMERDGLDAYIVYSNDPHGSEYVADHWKCRAWISGFTGSAGTLLVTKENAGLWTDSRYFIQADQELEGSGIDLYRMGTAGVPDYKDWLCSTLLPGSVVGVDGRTLTVKEWEALAVKFLPLGFSVANRNDLVGELWLDRPPQPSEKVWILGDDEAGESRESKLHKVRKVMEENGWSHYLISSLDDIAWLLNLRGGDVPFNPVVQSYCLISSDSAAWFVQGQKVPDPVKKELHRDSIRIEPYHLVSDFLTLLSPEDVLFFNGAKTCSFLAGSVPDGVKVFQNQDITTRMKACKNPVEVEQIRKVMEKDGAALVKFLKWLETEISRRSLTELEAAEALRRFRSGQEGFLDESFSPIPGYKAHGAICHYEADRENQFTMDSSGLFLIDSGGQYRQGTTDITRTVALGKPTSREIRDYTLVLKGHIALSLAKFPAGTRGYQLDVLARQALWAEGLNYGHGTGHGVGYILNVHEGPQRISPHPVDEALLPGMITSNEPGLYREGEYGIRIENLVLTVPWKECPSNGGEEFYCFETLSLCPYDRNLIDPSLLGREELLWLNSYHSQVRDRLSGWLDRDEKHWLEEATREIS